MLHIRRVGKECNLRTARVGLVHRRFLVLYPMQVAHSHGRCQVPVVRVALHSLPQMFHLPVHRLGGLVNRGVFYWLSSTLCTPD